MSTSNVLRDYGLLLGLSSSNVESVAGNYRPASLLAEGVTRGSTNLNAGMFLDGRAMTSHVASLGRGSLSAGTLPVTPATGEPVDATGRAHSTLLQNQRALLLGDNFGGVTGTMHSAFLSSAVGAGHASSFAGATAVFGNRGADGLPIDLPTLLALPEDVAKLSAHQVFLRHQIQAFRAAEDDILTHTRGRNKPIELGQVGICCRHCGHLPVDRRQKGSTYFPATVLGIYQAAQNMCTTHLQCGLCSEMPEVIKQEFSRLLSTKATSSGAGRPYWAGAAHTLGLVDSENNGIRFVRDMLRLRSSNGSTTSSSRAANLKRKDHSDVTRLGNSTT
jgi:hypothetical protein